MTDHQPDISQSSTGALLRLYWMFVGLAPLPIILIYIIKENLGIEHPLQAVYFLGIAALIAVRYVDIRYFDGKTGEGKPATFSDWKKYTVFALTIGVGCWIASRLFLAI